MTAPTSPSYVSIQDLIKQFLKAEVQTMKRIKQGAVDLVWTYLMLCHSHGLVIRPDDEVYLPSAQAAEMSTFYIDIREACCKMKGYHNRLEGTCDRITGWTDGLSNLYLNCLKTQLLIDKSLQLSLPLKEKRNDYHINLTPGADKSMYKHNGQTSARYYIGLQNLRRNIKSEIYEGCVDLDIVACFPQIFYKEVLKYDREANKYFNIMIDAPKFFLQMLEDDGVTTALGCDAKAARSRLFHPSQTVNSDGSRRQNRRSGIDWYDELAHFIVEQLRDHGVENEHLFFTGHEQRIVEAAFDEIGRENVVLRMHDGAICKDLVELEMLCKLLEIKTGYAWSWKQL